jgi:hypothetical protein
MKVLETIKFWVVKFCRRTIKWHEVWKSISEKNSKRNSFHQSKWLHNIFEARPRFNLQKICSITKKTSETQNWSFITTKLCQCIITGLCGASLQTFFCCCQFNDTTGAANHYSFLSLTHSSVALIKCRIFKYYWEQALKKHLKFLFTVPKCWKKSEKFVSTVQKANAIFCCVFFLY